MGLTYVNPGPKRGKRLAKTRRTRSARSRKNPIAKNWGRFGAGSRKKRSRSRAASAAVEKNPKNRKKKSMSRRKLYGAAAKSHARKMGRSKKRSRRRARKNPWVKRKLSKRDKKAGVTSAKRWVKKSSMKAKRSRSARKAARTRRAKKEARRAAARRSAHKRKHRGKARRTVRSTRRKARRSVRRTKRRAGRKGSSRRKKRHHAAPRRTRRRRRAGGRRTTSRSLARARRSIRNRRKTGGARAYMRRYHMRSNPSFSGVMDMIKQILPVAFSLYGARFASSKLATSNIPGLNQIPAQFQGVTMAGVVWGAIHFLTKKIGALQKYRGGAMLGAGLNFVDQAITAILPANIKAMIGLSDYVEMGNIYESGLSDYLSVGASPIDDDITLRDYIEVGALQEELGVEEELGGLQEELGAADGLSRAYLGGVAQSSMLKQIPSQPLLRPVPERSFTKDIRRAGQGYDNSDTLYGGIFGGGF